MKLATICLAFSSRHLVIGTRISSAANIGVARSLTLARHPKPWNQEGNKAGGKDSGVSPKKRGAKPRLDKHKRGLMIKPAKCLVGAEKVIRRESVRCKRRIESSRAVE